MKRNLSIVLCFVAASSASAQKTPATGSAAKPSISPAAVLDRYVEVTGGKAAYARLKTIVMKGTIAVTAQNLKGTVDVRAKAPNKFYTVQEIKDVTKTTMAFDGKRGWSKNNLQGLRDITGSELQQLKDQALFNSSVRWRELYPKVEMIGIRKVDGKDTYAIRLTPKVGKPTVQYHDTKTFLIVRTDSVQESPQGTLPVESYLSDYRAVDGVKTPFRVRSRVAAAEIITEITEVRNNVPVPDSLFVKPKE
ncbi:MAG: hypothetical protein SFU56_03680 [Capsulimonadales bacterium]|nr:hypothetical protein [Capsulimonadales bacterium]